MNTSQKLMLNSKRIKQLRQQNGLSQEAFADACEQRLIRISIATIKRAETNRPVSLRTAKNIATFYDVDLDELVTDYKDAVPLPHTTNNNYSNSLYLLISIQTNNENIEKTITSELANYNPQIISDCQYSKCFIINLKKLNIDYEKDIISHIHGVFLKAKQHTSLLHPVTFYVTSFQEGSDEQALNYVSNKKNKLTKLINLIPTNCVVVSENIKLTFNDKLYYNHIGIYSNNNLWSLDEELFFERKPCVELIGRDQEINEIIKIIDNSFDTKKPSLTCIHGQQGVGRTRILQEVSRFYYKLDVKVAYYDLSRKDIDWWSITEIVLSFINIDKNKVIIVIDNLDHSGIKTLRKINTILSSIKSSSFSIIASSDTKNIEKVNKYIDINNKMEVKNLDEDICKKDLINKLGLSNEQAETLTSTSSCIPLYLRMLLSRDIVDTAESLQILIQSKINSLCPEETQLLHTLSIYGQSISTKELNSVFNPTVKLQQLFSNGLIKFVDSETIELVNIVIQKTIIELQTDKEKIVSHNNAARIILSKADKLIITDWLTVQQHFLKANNKSKVAWCCVRIAGIYLSSSDYNKAHQSINYGLNCLSQYNHEDDKLDINYNITVEIDLKLLLAKLYMHQLGWGYYKIEPLYLQVLQQCELVSATSRKMETLFGLWSYNLSNCNITNANYYAHKAQEISENCHDDYYRVMTLTALSNTSLWLGNHEDTIKYAFEALMFYNENDRDNYQIMDGQDPRMLPYHTIIISKALLEQEDGPVMLKNLLDITEDQNNSFNHAMTYQTAALYYWLQRDQQSAHFYATKLYEISEKHDYSFYRGIAQLIIGWSKFTQTQDPKYISQIVQAYEVQMVNAGGELCYSIYSVILAETLLSNHQYETAATLLKTAIEKCNEDRTECYLPKLLALQAFACNNNEGVRQALSHPLCTPRQRSIIENHITQLMAAPI
ncbi:helix-turn-helix domain-containing protein [Photobacterium sp. DNB23_23_1]